MLKKLFTAFLFILAFSVLSHAACTGSSPTWTTTADETSVASCISQAVDNDTINITAGTPTWTVGVTWTGKKLTIAGPTCTLNAAGQPTACPVTITVSVATAITANICAAADFVNISNIAFEVTTASGSGVLSMSCSAANGYPEQSFRIHHIRITGSPGTSPAGRWITSYANYGLVDHSYFSSATMGNIAMLFDNTRSTCNSYHEPFSLGDANALYIEDNFFYSNQYPAGNGMVDNYSGARYVFRFNTVYNNETGHHGLDSQSCGVPTFENYGNTYIAESGIGSIQAIHVRSGTGIIWGNKIQNVTGAANGYISLMRPIYYFGMSTPEAISIGALWYGVGRPARYYPTGTWGAPYTGTSNYDDGLGNYASGSNFLDRNSQTALHMDSATTRTVTDLVMTAGSKTITSATASFVASDVTGYKAVHATNFTEGRPLSCTTTNGDATVTCSGGNFTSGDVDRQVSSVDRTTVSGIKTVASVTNSTTIELSANANATGTAVLIFADPYIVSVTNSTTAVMNVPATANGTGGTLSIGYKDQGYPLADQPGYGYFASANAGLWPTQTSYSAANYETLMPIYSVGNLWQTVNGSLVVQTSTNPPATSVYFPSTAGYMKADREWYDPYPNQAGAGIQTNATTPFNGTSGTGIGTIANIPTTCTVGVGYWAVNEGTWNSGSFTYTYPNGGSTYTQGRFYKCVTTDDWDLYYTPYDYPHPLQGGTTLTSVTPDFGPQDATTGVTLVGAGFDGGNFAVQITPSTNITINNIAGSGATTRTADFVIAAGAATGDRAVTVSTDDGTSNAVTFTVIASGSPTILTAIAPPQGTRGATYSMAFTGTGFDGGNAAIVEACSGLAFTNLVVVSATKITALLTLDSDASLVPCSVTISTDGGTSNAEIFTINALPLAGYGKGRTRGRR